MANLEKFSAKICYTASGILIYRQKVLLVWHKKLQTWLPPGGHIDSNELPHRAAEREFWEETGVKVEAISPAAVFSDQESQFLPLPICANLHWVCQQNYRRRLSGENLPAVVGRQWSRGCEQHYNLSFLVRPLAKIVIRRNRREVEKISWFGEEEIERINLRPAIKREIRLAWKTIKNITEETEKGLRVD